MKCSICIFDTQVQNNGLEKTKQSLEKNQKFISEIIVTTSNSKINETKDIRYLNVQSPNIANHYNNALQEAHSDYLLFLSPNIELEDETLEEFAEIVEEYPDADIIYPNEVIIAGDEEKIKNYSDWYGKEKELISSLAIEDHLPQWAVLVKKETLQKLGGFDPKYGEHSWYAFIYKNLENLKLKLSDLSFVNHYDTSSFIDTSYRSLLIRDIVKQYGFHKLFPALNWKNENIALATANTLVGNRLAIYYDYFNASNFYRNALLAFHNQETLKKLLEAYYQMGLFEEMEKLLQTQDANPELIQDYEEKIKNTQELIKALENSIKEGHAAEILMAASDIAQYYQGAPIYNILGVIHFIKGDLLEAYRFFYKAVTMNPLDNDIIHNLIDLAKQLKKEDEVIGLMNRLTKEV